MTTTTYDPGSRPLHQVLSPDDYADVRRRLQRGRWWRFLNARDRLLALARRAGRTAADLAARAVGRFRLQGTAPAVGRAVRWTAGRAGLAAAALRAAGPVPMLTWAASTCWGQTVLGAAARTAVTAVAAVGRTGAGVLALLVVLCPSGVSSRVLRPAASNAHVQGVVADAATVLLVLVLGVPASV